MELLLEDRFWLDCLELGLELFGSMGTRVASAAGVRQIVLVVFDLIALAAPAVVPLASHHERQLTWELWGDDDES